MTTEFKEIEKVLRESPEILEFMMLVKDSPELIERAKLIQTNYRHLQKNYAIDKVLMMLCRCF